MKGRRRVVVGNAGAGRPLSRLWWRIPTVLVVWSLWAAPTIAALVALTMVRGWARELPELPDLAAWQQNVPRTSRIVAADNTLLEELPFSQGVEVGRRELATHLPRILIDAILAAEDVRYVQHPGVDLQSVARAALANYRAGHVVEGASTITQQLVRNLLPEEIGTTQSARRKVREGLLAVKLEQRYSKAQMLLAYANLVFLGNNSYGVVAAARSYFDRNLDELSVAEAATLAGLIQAPGRTDPTRDPKAALARRNEVLARMEHAGFVDEETAASALATPLTLRTPETSVPIAPWYAEQVRQVVAESMPDEANRGGLRIETAALPALSLVAQAEAAAQTANLAHGESPPEVAAAMWDHHTGYIEMLVGGRDATASQFNRMLQSCRQPGSAWKPIVYAAALEQNAITQGTALRDAPVTEYDEATNLYWKPRAGRNFRGVLLAADALALSRNPAAIEVLDRVGAASVIDLARRLGIATSVADVRPMALGASCVRPIELLRAYGMLARRGWRLPARLVTRIMRGEQVLRDDAAVDDPWLAPDRRFDRLAATAGMLPDERIGASPSIGRVVDEDTAFLIDDMLTGAVLRGTATAARSLRRPIAGKTGTTNDNTDAWFVGFTGRVASAVWIGHDDQATELGPKDDGAHAALPLWMTLVSAAEGSRPAMPVPGAVPAGLVRARIDRETGLLAAPGTSGRELWFRPGTAPVDVASGPVGAGADFGRTSGQF